MWSRGRNVCSLRRDACCTQLLGNSRGIITRDRQSFKPCNITSVSVHSYYHTLTPIMFSSPSNEIQVFLPMHNKFIEFLPILSFVPLYLGAEWSITWRKGRLTCRHWDLTQETQVQGQTLPEAGSQSLSKSLWAGLSTPLSPACWSYHRNAAGFHSTG